MTDASISTLRRRCIGALAVAASGIWMPAYAELYLPPLATLYLKYDPA